MSWFHYIHAAFVRPSDQLILRNHAAKYRSQMHPSYLIGEGFDFSRDSHNVAFARREEAYHQPLLIPLRYSVIDNLMHNK